MLRDRIEDSSSVCRDAIYVTIGLLVVTIIMNALDIQKSSHNSTHAKVFLDQAVRWYEVSLQDKQTIVAFQHIDYAMSYFSAARHLANDTALEQLTGVDIHNLYKQLDVQQKKVTKDVYAKLGLKTKGKNMNAWIM